MRLCPAPPLTAARRLRRDRGLVQRVGVLLGVSVCFKGAPLKTVQAVFLQWLPVKVTQGAPSEKTPFGLLIRNITFWTNAFCIQFNLLLSGLWCDKGSGEIMLVYKWLFQQSFLEPPKWKPIVSKQATR